jgi:hypothetical protein
VPAVGAYVSERCVRVDAICGSAEGGGPRCQLARNDKVHSLVAAGVVSSRGRAEGGTLVREGPRVRVLLHSEEAFWSRGDIGKPDLEE